ncbi:MAG: 16S rRNA (guanine(527)-N(7))-methyltransferase RsmG [Proteobacteria bacterium]|nr:16S rRNA (guanine(527)-N(7))-methyltransferase RsmG [Pseudomonadota bacterium]
MPKAETFQDFLDGCARIGVAVSPAQAVQLERYAQLLIQWQAKFNLVGPETLPFLYTRHLLDSAQLVPYVGSGKKILDIGSGAGFPALVLAILTDNHVTACERVGKKVQFMMHVSRETGLKEKFSVLQEDVRKVNGHFDVISARALADLQDLFSWTEHLKEADTVFVFPKGETVNSEIAHASKFWDMTTQLEESITFLDAKVLIATDVRRKR